MTHFNPSQHTSARIQYGFPNHMHRKEKKPHQTRRNQESSLTQKCGTGQTSEGKKSKLTSGFLRETKRRTILT